MYTIKVLDKGFVTLRNIAGPTRRIGNQSDCIKNTPLRDFDADDRDPAQAARLSFEQGEFGEEKRRAHYRRRHETHEIFVA